MPSIRSVTMKPPTMLIVPKAIAITPMTFSSVSSAEPITISPPSMTMPWIALVCDISGVCRVVGTFEMTSKPTKAARTKIVISVIRLMTLAASLALSLTISPSLVSREPAMTSSSVSTLRLPSSSISSSTRFCRFLA